MNLAEAISGLGRPFLYFPRLAREVGVNECIIVCFLVWRLEPGKDPVVVATARQVLEETSLTFKQQRLAVARLCSLGIVERKVIKNIHRTEWHLDLAKLDQLLTKVGAMPPTEACAQRATPTLPKGNRHVPKGKVAIIEGTEKGREEKEEGRPSGRAVPSTPHHLFIDAWVRSYQDHFGSSYLFQKDKDGPATKRLLTSGLEPEMLAELVRKAWSCGCFFCQNASTIAGFASRFNEIRAHFTLSVDRPRPRTIVEMKIQKDALESKLKEIRNRGTEGPMTFDYHSDEDREMARKIKARIRELNNKLAGT